MESIIREQPENISTRGSPDERFKRLAEQRVNVIVDKLRLLGQLSNRRNYTYTEQQVDKIFRTLKTELRDTQAKFGAKDKQETRRFQL